ncbi:MAG: hypothetical protein ACRDVZ_05135, partial [Jiangellaceae bacterium]
MEYDPMRTTRSRTLILAAFSAALIAGCSADTGAVAERSTDQQATDQAAASETTATDEAGPAEEGTAGPATFADAVAYDDGLKVEVAAISHTTASEYAIGAEASGGEVTVFDVRITNGSTGPFDPVLVYPNLTYGEAGNQAEPVYD